MLNLICPECGEKVYPSDDVCMNCGAKITGKATVKQHDETKASSGKDIGAEILVSLGMTDELSEKAVRPTQFKKKKKKLGCLPVFMVFGFILVTILGWVV